jgi:hypothetical protein
MCFEKQCPSPDGSENPFEKKRYFFLFLLSDQRKLLRGRRKKAFLEKDCNVQLEIAPQK